MKIKEGGGMDIQNNSVVTDVDTEILDGEITQISNDFSETYYFDGEQEEELEMLVAKAMKLGELYERKKWQAAKAQADQKIKLLLCDEHLKKCESPTGVFNSQYPDEEPCLICLTKQAKAQAVPEWIRMEDKYPKAGESVLICINGIRQNIAYFYDCSVNEYSDHDWFEPVFTGGEAGDECVVKTEDVTHWMLLPKEPAND